MHVWTYGKYYIIDDNVNFSAFINEKRIEWEKEQVYEAIKKENERLKNELIEKERQLALAESWKVNPPNGSTDASPDTLETIMEEGKYLASQFAMDGLTNAFLQKGIKIKWKER